MSPAFLEASLAGDRDAAARAIGLAIPADWPDERHVLEMRLAQLREDPRLAEWLMRAITPRNEARMIGHVGFHTAPGQDYLRELSPGGIELGYTIFEAERRHGYAAEAIRALIGWARASHGLQRFVVSIRPDNEPSLRLARKLGFTHHIGSHVDEVDGPEDVYELRFDLTS
jgi:RimJ/RimL family protein N-acetyltransferase